MPADTETAPASGPTPSLRLVLIDGSGFIFRAFHALPPMTRPDGTPVNAVYGFVNMLARIIREHKGTHLAVVFDAARETFRNRLYPDYKAHRPPPPPDLVPQFALVREAARVFGVPVVEAPDWEADDLIAAYARAAERAGGEALIISSDKDLMQLIGPHVQLLDPIKEKPIDREAVIEKFGVPPEKMIDLQALMGDSTDNVPGVPGIGPKGAALLLAEYGDLESILAAAPAMKPSKRRDALLENAERARLSRALVTLRDDAPLPLPLEALTLREPDREKLRAWLTAQGFRSILHRLGLERDETRRAPAGEGMEGKAEAKGGGKAEEGPGKPPSAHSPSPPAARETEGGEAPAAGGSGAAAGTDWAGIREGYVTLDSAEKLARFLAAAREEGVIAVDTETDSLDPWQARLVGIALATAAGRAGYLPLAHREGMQLAAEQARAALVPLLADASVLKVFHNAKFDLAVLRSNGFGPVGPVDDTMLISYVQSAGLHGQGLDELARLHLGASMISYAEVTAGARGRPKRFDEVGLAEATLYAAEDADMTLRLWHLLRPGLHAVRAIALYEYLERRLIPVLLAMEERGVLVDASVLARLSKEFAERLAAMEREIQALAPRPFNVASPKQIGEILFDDLKLPGARRGKSGAYVTDSAVLQALAEEGHELPARILEWRALAKLKSTYTDALPQQINPRTGRIHTRFSMAATSTGRLSSTDPNLQNIPVKTEEGGRIRQAFVAPPGCLLLSADYSQIELRLLAHVADIPALRESFARGEDIHARTAAEVFGVPLEAVDAALRRRAKAINFGIIYGISPFGLARQTGVSPAEARGFIEAYFARYPGIRAYMEAKKEEARRQGFVVTPFGRRCFIPGINDRSAARRAYAERQAINAPLQGGAADIIKRAMVRLHRRLAEEGFDARMILQVHDELLFEVPEGELGRLARLVREVMEGVVRLSVPLRVDLGAGPNWADLEPVTA